MSDGGSAERTVLNWRGPLLAAGIFAVAFAALLLMAHRNQSNASDMGSSLREDPYGTSLSVRRVPTRRISRDSRTGSRLFGGPECSEHYGILHRRNRLG